MSNLESALAGETLRAGRFDRTVKEIQAAKLKPDENESVASVHENHAANISTAMKAVRALGGNVTAVKHLDYNALPMLKKKGVATGDMAKSTVHFNSGKKKFKLHVRTAHKIGMEGGEQNRTFSLDNDEAKDPSSDPSGNAEDASKG